MIFLFAYDFPRIYRLAMDIQLTLGAIMKIIISFILSLAICLFSVSSSAVQHHKNSKASANAQAETGAVTVYFFWSNDCPHCVAAHPFLDKLKQEYSWLKIQDYEISGSAKNAHLFEKMAKDHGRETSFVPTFFICDKMIVGYTNAATTGEEIRQAVNACHDKKSK